MGPRRDSLEETLGSHFSTILPRTHPHRKAQPRTTHPRRRYRHRHCCLRSRKTNRTRIRDRNRPFTENDQRSPANNEKNKLRNVFFIDMNGGHMLFPDRLFARVLSNCGISPGTFPQTSRDIFRVLRDDGTLILNDWHLIDVPPHRTFSEILRRYRTDSPSRKLGRWREALAILERVGNQYGDSERAVLQRAGFKRITERTKNFQIVLPSMQAYLKMRFERIALRQELLELSPSRRRRLLTELKRSLAMHIHNGQFTFKWNVRFISAAKQ